MQLLPVIDLLDGRVVHAIAGRRAHYRPLRSALCATSAPLDVAGALLGLAPFPALYVADLDAIMHERFEHARGVLPQLCALLQEHGTPGLWVDAGWRDGGRAPWRTQLQEAARAAGVDLSWVVGTESMAPAAPPPPALCVLSLDRRGAEPLDPSGCGARPDLWPARVIVMDLHVVGTGGGPPLEGLRSVQAQAAAAGRADVRCFAAGGVRDRADLAALRAAGAAGALIATALHSGRLTAADLAPYRACAAPPGGPAPPPAHAI